MSVLNPAVPTISEALLNTSDIVIINGILVSPTTGTPQSYAYILANTTEPGFNPWAVCALNGVLMIIDPVPEVHQDAFAYQYHKLGRFLKNQKNILVDRILSRTRFVVPDEGITRRKSH